MNKIHLFLLTIIVFLGVLLRFQNSTSIPKCINWDEAAFSYNAYSLLLTGKDEYGVEYPFEFKSVGDYKFPFFIYSLVPTIKTFGLTEFAVRFLPALAGSLSIIVIYALSIKVFNSKVAALLSAFLLATSPWHIQFSRGGSDVGYSSFFLTIGFLGVVLLSKKKNLGILLTALGFSLASYTYYADRFLTLLVIIIIGSYFIFRNHGNKVYNKLTALLFVILLAPLLYFGASSGQQSKFTKTTLFGADRPLEYEQQLLAEDQNSFTFQAMHNIWYERSFAIANHYLNHFSPSFLFLKGPEQDVRNKIFGMGVLYLTELPLIVFGIHSALKKRTVPVTIILLWLLIAPIPSAVTRDIVHARRSMSMAFPLTIFAGYGAFQMILLLKQKLSPIIRSFILSGYTIMHLYLISFFILSYFIITPKGNYKGPAGWQCGYKEVVEATQKYKESYDTIVIDTLYQGPYLFYLFYEKYPPEKYHPQAKLDISDGSLGEGPGYDNYVFRPIYWPEDRKLKKTLFIGAPEKLPLKDIKEGEAKLIETVNFFNGEAAFVFVETL